MKNTNPSNLARLRRASMRSLLGFLGLAVLTFGQAAPATAQLTITQVFVDVPAPNQITINGQDLNNGPNLVVTLGDFALPLVIVDPPMPTANQIIANLPPAMPVGDFLLTVTTGNGPNRQDTYGLTIGAQVAGVPTNAIILWNQSTTCPTGFSRVATFDGLFLVGGDTLGVTGGSINHTHGAGALTGPAHRHNLEPWDQSFAPVDDNSGGTDFNARTDVAGGGTLGGTTASTDGRPPFRTILLCRRT